VSVPQPSITRKLRCKEFAGGETLPKEGQAHTPHTFVCVCSHVTLQMHLVTCPMV
jgi:hypothetical protein